MILTSFAATAVLALSNPDPSLLHERAVASERQHAHVKVLRARRVHRLRARVVRAAASRLGLPYVYGATGPYSFDCSGLTQWAYKRIGRYLPRTTYTQRYSGKAVGRHALRRGDLVFSYGFDHVAIYAGHGTVIVAPRTGYNVEREPLAWLPWAGARRIIHKKR